MPGNLGLANMGLRLFRARVPSGILKPSSILISQHQFSTTSLAAKKINIRQIAKANKPELQSAPKTEEKPNFLRRIGQDPKRRKILALSMILFYLLTGWAGLRYLQDTKYKAMGEKNPYHKLDADGNIIEGNAHEIKVISGHDTTPVYDGLAKDYDDKIWFEEISSYIWYMRRKLMKHVHGDVLEVSCGTGRNIKYLDLPKVKSLTLLDSSRPMLELAKEKFEDRNPAYENVQYVQGRAEDLLELTAKSNQTFDTVYESFGLCSHEDPNKALNNMKNLVRPGGKIVLLEHGRGYYESMNNKMDDKAAERAKEWGCRWNLDIEEIVRKSELKIEQETRYHFGTIYFYVLSVPKK